MNKGLILVIVVLVALFLIFRSGARFLPSSIKFPSLSLPEASQPVKVINEQSVVVDVVKSVGPSVITIGVDNSSRPQVQNINPFFGLFNQRSLPSQNQNQPAEDYIGSGFIVAKDGLIVTNKHVVADTTLKYVVVDSKGNKYTVGNIYRDPLNDLAILKISTPPAGGFKEISFGDSGKLEVGQFAIAIGTALGQFRNTVTTGVISGLGRGISAGSPYEGYVEQLDNVIQTDAAINPGNSGGPLLNVAGQVIGINTAVASQGQNIGFAIPINLVKQSINNFNSTGQFDRGFLGVSYALIDINTALLNDLPQGALVRQIVAGSPAETAGVQINDIITKIDGQKITDKNSLAQIINSKKVGDKVEITVYRDSKTMTLTATLTSSTSQ